MYRGNGKDEAAFYRVQNAVGEDSGEPSSDIFIENSPTFWSVDDSLDCVFNGVDKASTKYGIAFSLIAGCLAVFRECLWWNSHLIGQQCRGLV
jgi:hypothetical protein